MAATRDARQLTMIRQMQSTDPVYRKISSLHHDTVERSRTSQFGDEILSFAWAQDESLFAWSVGTGTVYVHAISKMLPTFEGHTRRPSRSDLKEHFAREMGSLDSEVGIVARLDCGHPVTCMAFGCRSSEKRWHANEVKYSRFNTKDLLVLAVGLATGDIKVFELSTGKLMLILKDHEDAIAAIQFAPDGSLVMCSSSKDYTVKLWDLMDDGNMFKTLIREERNKPFNYIAFSPDASKLIIVGDGKLALLFDLTNCQMIRSLKGHQNDVTACCFSDDGKHIFTSSFDTRVICWDAETGQICRQFEHMDPPPSTIFASGTNDHEVIGMDAKHDRLATICNDGNLRIWDTLDEKSDKPISVTAIVPDASRVSFNADGHLLAVACHGGFLEFFMVD
jgi:WD repeat/SOCS box-containing protein 1